MTRDFEIEPLTPEEFAQLDASWAGIEAAMRKAIEPLSAWIQAIGPSIREINRQVMGEIDAEPPCEEVELAEEEELYCTTHREFGCRIAKLRAIYRDTPRPAPEEASRE
jgi:hypothetical protein